MPLGHRFHTPTKLLLIKRFFGVLVGLIFALITNKNSLFRSKECVFLGYCSLHKGCKCLDTDSGHVYISRDIIFDGNVFLFKRAPPSSSSTLQPTHNAPDLCNLHLGNNSTNLENDHIHIFVPTNSLDAENMVPTSASGLPPQSFELLLRESTSVGPPMIGASDPPPADDIA